MVDLKDQLKNLFPDHKIQEDSVQINKSNVWLQDEPLICKYEKRRGKQITIIEGYNGAVKDFKILAKEIKTKLSVGGSFKNESIIKNIYTQLAENIIFLLLLVFLIFIPMKIKPKFSIIFFVGLIFAINVIHFV